MKQSFTFLFIILSIPVFAQFHLNLHAKAEYDVGEHFEQGDDLVIVRIMPSLLGTPIVIKNQHKLDKISWDELYSLSYLPKDLNSFWQEKALRSGMYRSLIKNGRQLPLRNELHEELKDYLRDYYNNNLNFEDDFVNSHLQSLVNQIYPGKLGDGRRENIGLKVIKSRYPEIYMFSTGDLFITTGLFSTINSEQELIALLVHEISHYALDHQVRNISGQAQRLRRAQFWGQMATGMASIADDYLAAKNQYHPYGLLTYSAGAAAFLNTAQVYKRFGMVYSKEQELEADECARELLSFLKYDPNALSSALHKIRHYYLRSGEAHLISENSNHPHLHARIAEAGPYKQPAADSTYGVKYAVLHTQNARFEMDNHHYKRATDLLKRNIKAGQATADDHLLMASSLLYSENSNQSNQLALEHLKQAEKLSPYGDFNIYKQASIAYLRLGNKRQSRQYLKRYQQSCEMIIKDDPAAANYLSSELDWAEKMVLKTR